MSRDLSRLIVSLVHRADQSQHRTSRALVKTYDDNAFPPSACPLAADEADPISITEKTRSHWYSRVELYTHAEVEFQRRSRELQRPSDLAFIEPVQEVVCRNRVFDDVQVGRTLLKVLALSASILGPDLVAIYALD